jgi:hypothetical protein
MGDRLGTPRAVGKNTLLHCFLAIFTLYLAAYIHPIVKN